MNANTHRHMYPTHVHQRTHPLIRCGTGQLLLIVLLHQWCSAAVGWDWEHDHLVKARKYLAHAMEAGVSTPSSVLLRDVRNLQSYQSQLLLSYWTGMTINLHDNYVYPHPGSDHYPGSDHCSCMCRNANILSIPNCDTRRDVRVCARDGSDVQYAMGGNACKLYDGNCCEYPEERLA